MAISLKPDSLRRYRDIARLLLKYGRSDLIRQAGINDDVLNEEIEKAKPGKVARAEELTTDLEKLGATFVKLGQLLSTRPDLLPDPFLEALSRLQDNVAPFSFAEVEQMVTEELGFRPSKVFQFFEAEPIAAASLGQVHLAILRTGRKVAVKVQRPGVRRQVAEDLEALQEVAIFLNKHTTAGQRYDFEGLLEEFRKTIFHELDYRMEARNLTTLRDNLREYERIKVPSPIDDLTTSRVLTMEYIEGKKITDIGPLSRTETQTEDLAEELFRAYLKQILVDGFFHADPHPGNVFITPDRNIALLDLGMVGRLTPRLQDLLLQLVLAVSEGRGEDAADWAMASGEKLENFDERQFRNRTASLVAERQNLELEKMQVGSALLELARISGESGMRLPPEMALLGKTLLNLDLIGRTLDPTFDPNASIRKNVMLMMRQRLSRSFSPGAIAGSVLETRDFLEKLPGRVNRILDAAAANELSLKVDAIDENALIRTLQKIANRITLGLVCAALIIGAAMLMRVQTTFTILGYPGLAIILFLMAAAGGLMLIFAILYSDRKGTDA